MYCQEEWCRCVLIDMERDPQFNMKPKKTGCETVHTIWCNFIFKIIYLDILKTSERAYKKLETVITFGWKDLDFLISFIFFLSEYVFLLQSEK